MDRAVILCSGGLNSAVSAAVAAQDYKLALLHVRYGHRAAEQDAGCFDALADHFNPAERLIIDMPHFAAIGGSARLDAAATIPPYSATRDQLAATFVPGLIGSLLSAAYAWAGRVFLGVCENLGPPAPRTAMIWPDYSREYNYYWNHLFSAGSGDASVTLETPLIDLNRADIVRLGRRLEVPFERTWSCIASGA